MSQSDSVRERAKLIDSRLAKLRAQRDRLISRASRAERRRDTRQKIVIGAIDALHSGLGTMSSVLDTVTKQVRALMGETALQELLKLEAEWLARAERFVVVQRLRQYEVETFWPADWSRWATATLLAMVGIALFGIGFAWETRPYRDQIADLQPRPPSAMRSMPGWPT